MGGSRETACIGSEAVSLSLHGPQRGNRSVKPVLFLVFPGEARSAALAEALESEAFRVISVGAGAVSSTNAVLPDVVVLDLVGSTELLLVAETWRNEPARASVPLAAVVTAGDLAVEEAAWAAGVDEVLPWPAAAGLMRRRLRGLAQARRLSAEILALEELVGNLVTVFESREPHTFEHGRRVSQLAGAMAADAGLSTETCERVRRGGLLHDIGALVLPDRVYALPAEFDPNALDELRAHVVVGYELLRGIPSLEPLLPFVHRHHERLDGSGFPDGLKGDQIPFPVQVVSLADACDSLTSSRPYRAVFSHESALEVLRAEARSGRWDPALIPVLERACGAGKAGTEG